MKKLILASLTGLLTLCAASSISGDHVVVLHDDGYFIYAENVTDKIPEIEVNSSNDESEWKMIPNVAQYTYADWSTCVGIAHNVSVNEAKRIADENPEITFFFHMKGIQMVLVNQDYSPPLARIFHQGDAVFFTGDPATTAVWGSAVGYADGYEKQ